MKLNIFKLFITALFVLIIASCAKDNTSDWALNGNCLVENIALDNYEGTVDIRTRTITVRVPEGYKAEQMAVTQLTVSPQATCSVKEGDSLNLTTPQTIRVQNGDVFLDWTLRVIQDEARITEFQINNTYTGVINETNKTIMVYVPNSLDVTTLIPTFTVSANASTNHPSGIAIDFTNPVSFIVSNNSAQSTYTVTVMPIGKPSAVFVGLATTMDGLNIEEQTACQWMLANIPNSLYVSFNDIQNNLVDLSECKVIWWHYHKDGGVDGKNAFEQAAPQAVSASQALRTYYEAGGSFLFTRFAVNMPAYLGATGNDVVPNNCWGQNEADAETVSSPWSFSMANNTTHPLYQNLVMNSNEPNNVYTCDAGYRITNSTAQWHIGTDWGGYDDLNQWRIKTGAKDLGYGGDGAVVAWEFAGNATKGAILCIGSGCYDWYSVASVPEYYHRNMEILTRNAFNYLIGQSKK